MTHQSPSLGDDDANKEDPTSLDLPVLHFTTITTSQPCRYLILPIHVVTLPSLFCLLVTHDVAFLDNSFQCDRVQRWIVLFQLIDDDTLLLFTMGSCYWFDKNWECAIICRFAEVSSQWWTPWCGVCGGRVGVPVFLPGHPSNRDAFGDTSCEGWGADTVRPGEQLRDHRHKCTCVRSCSCVRWSVRVNRGQGTVAAVVVRHD